jgi:hypothetical protein
MNAVGGATVWGFAAVKQLGTLALKYDTQI